LLLFLGFYCFEVVIKIRIIELNITQLILSLSEFMLGLVTELWHSRFVM